MIGRRAVPALVERGHRVVAVARTEEKAAALRSVGAEPVSIDLVDRGAVRRAVDGIDAMINLATHIPTGAAAGTKRAWRTNDRLRREVAPVIAEALVDVGVPRLVQESVTFPYVDRGDRWIDESVERVHAWNTASSDDAERAAASVTHAGGHGVVLRFAMFASDDSDHLRTFGAMARRGLWGMFGADEAYVSFVQVDDAAAAIVAALDAPAGVYNVAEPDPQRRGAHRDALATAVGRARLRGLPRLAERAGGEAAAMLARSQRISSAALTAATGWRPERSVIDVWPDVV